MMERLEFEVLSATAENVDFNLRADTFGFSAADIKSTKEQLHKKGLLENGMVTDIGLKALEPYQVKRAVFLAAGFGSRMMPITYNTPKPLVKVHGKRIIETLIDAVLDARINEIYIVRGYLGEQFELLQKKYPMIKLIDNPEYAETGTISSFYYARDLLRDAYVFESDLVMKNPRVIRKYHFASDFMGTKVTRTNDWFLRAGQDGMIYEIGVDGSGEDLYKLIGISFWCAEDGQKLSAQIKEAYEAPNGKKLPMSYVPFRIYKDQYHVSIAPCKYDDVIEIDSFRELQAFDEKYMIPSIS